MKLHLISKDVFLTVIFKICRGGTKNVKKKGIVGEGVTHY